MSVTVVVPSTGRDGLRRFVEGAIRAAAPTGPDAEVLVVVNGCSSVPDLDHMGSPLLRVMYLDRRNVSRARNVGIAAARNDTVLFGDDGAEIAPTWCADLARGLDDPLYPVVTAPVRVPVNGPVTAYLNHQRVFDAPPVDEVEAGTVTGHCGIRRDRLPLDVRYDEANLPLVGEDVAFGHAVRAAGLRIRWLAGAPPGWHLLPERIEELTERAFRYGRGAALVRDQPGVNGTSPDAILAHYRYLTSADYTAYRRFFEVDGPARAVFTIYDHLYDLAYLTGYLAEVGGAFLEFDDEGLRRAWHAIAARAAASLPGDGRVAPPVDFTHLDDGAPTRHPLIDDLRHAADRYAPIAPVAAHRPSDPVSSTIANGQHPQLGDGYLRLANLLAAWWAVRAQSRADDLPIGADAVDHLARAAGFRFRDACVAIERSALRSAARAAKGTDAHA